MIKLGIWIGRKGGSRTLVAVTRIGILLAVYGASLGFARLTYVEESSRPAPAYARVYPESPARGDNYQ